MGLNISIYTAEGKEVQEWDHVGGYVGDRQLDHLLYDNGAREFIGNPEYGYFRPKTLGPVKQWIEANRNDPNFNLERFEQFVSLLENNPDYLVHVGY